MAVEVTEGPRSSGSVVDGSRAAELTGGRTWSALAILESATVPQANCGTFFFLARLFGGLLKYIFLPR